MALPKPQINDVELPGPSASSAPEWKKAPRGSGRIMADGSAVFDWVSADKREWVVKWQNIDDADLGKLITAHNSLVGASSSGIKWEPTSGGTYYVTLNPSNLDLDVQEAKAAGTIRYNVTLYLREV